MKPQMRVVSALLLVWSAAILPAWAQETVVYYHTDAIGSVRAITDATGQTIARYDYLPFGIEMPPTGPAEVKQYAGSERDANTGLDYFGARYYASQTGRFAVVDPVLDVEQALVDPQRWNRYSYGLNNPLKFMDPDGRNPVAVAAGIIWGLYEIGSSIYDAYATYQTVRDPDASATEKLTTSGLFAIGMLPGVPGGAAAAERAAIRHADDVFEVAAGARAYRHTFGELVDNIRQHGLLRNNEGKVFATPTGGLSSLAAQIELALPGSRLRNTVVKIDLEGLRRAGYKIPKPTRVSGRFGQPGGGWEYEFDYDIPAKYLIWE